MKDVLVLGSGPAGYYASILCATNGLDVVLVEKEKLGGTGFANGALPIKILLDGIKQNPHITYEHLRKEYTRKMTYCQEKIMSDLKQAKVNLVIGETGFKDKNTISVNGKDISAKNIIIATGSRPSDGFGVVYGKNVMTHREALSLKNLPKDIIIIGANVEGIEFATLFSKYGIKVTAVEMMQDILSGNDDDLKKPVIDGLKKLDVNFITGEEIVKLEENNDKVVVTLRSGKTATAEKCLICTSRVPNIPKGASDIGIEYESLGIKTDDCFITCVPNIYAVGDVNGKCLMANAAINQGIVAALKILNKKVQTRKNNYEGIPRAIFTIQEIAGVGLQEWELREKGIKYKIAKQQLVSTWRGISKGYTDGFIKVLVDNEDRLQGVWMVGRDASELVGNLDILLNQKVSAGLIKNSLFVHPSLSEALLDALIKLT